MDSSGQILPSLEQAMRMEIDLSYYRLAELKVCRNAGALGQPLGDPEPNAVESIGFDASVQRDEPQMDVEGKNEMNTGPAQSYEPRNPEAVAGTFGLSIRIPDAVARAYDSDQNDVVESTNLGMAVPQWTPINGRGNQMHTHEEQDQDSAAEISQIFEPGTIFWPCHICGDLYTTEIGLLKHVQDSHAGGSAPYKCFCDEEFRSSRGLNVHVAAQHPEVSKESLKNMRAGVSLRCCAGCPQDKISSWYRSTPGLYAHLRSEKHGLVLKFHQFRHGNKLARQ